jgi:hypothetical protein
MAIIYATGPVLNTIMAAYNPVKVQVQDDGAGGATPVVYCDVYLNDVYYKTVTSSSPILISGASTVWEIDISGVAQEYLQSVLPSVGNPYSGADPFMQELFRGPAAYNPNAHGGACRCYVRLRRGTPDSYGVITPDGPVPVQGTVDSAAISGGGYMLDYFLILNAALQLNTERTINTEYTLTQNKRTGIFSTAGYSVMSQHKIYPLSHMIDAKVYANDYGQFPIVIKKNGIYAPIATYIDTALFSLAIELYDVSGVRIHANFVSWQQLYGESIYSIPTGIKNLLILFPGMAPYLHITHYYQVFLYDNQYSSINPLNVNFVTPKYYLQQGENPSPTEHVRMWFRNFLGHMEAMNFRIWNEKGKVSSSTTERRMTIQRQVHSTSRNNVRSARMAEISDVFDEHELPLIEELACTAQAWIETTNGPYATPAGAGVMMPVVLEDIDYEVRKYEDRYQYEVAVKYSLSHETVTVRG